MCKANKKRRRQLYLTVKPDSNSDTQPRSDFPWEQMLKKMIESGFRISLKSNYLDPKGGKRCGQDIPKLNTKNKTTLRYQITKGSLALL